MEKYIFLDFDGVINTQNDKFDKNAVANLRRLLERTDAKVVVSSTWRLQGMEYILQLWQENHLPGEVIGLTPSCNSINFSNVDGQEEWQGLHRCKGLEGSPDKPRGLSIQPCKSEKEEPYIRHSSQGRSECLYLRIE